MKPSLKSRKERRANARNTSNIEVLAGPIEVLPTPIFSSMSSVNTNSLSSMNSAHVGSSSPLSHPVNRSSPVSHSLISSSTTTSAHIDDSSSDRPFHSSGTNAILRPTNPPTRYIPVDGGTPIKKSSPAMPLRKTAITSPDFASFTADSHESFDPANSAIEGARNLSIGDQANIHKSSSVIKAQILEIVALKKEKATLLAQLEDVTKSKEAAIAQNETLKVRNLHLSAMCGIHSAVMERTEDRMGTLKARLAVASAARENTEREQREIIAERNASVEACEKRVAEQKAIAEDFKRQSRALVNSWEAESVKKLKEDVAAITQQSLAEERRLRKLQIVSMQQERELKTASKAYRDLQAELRKYKQEPTIRDFQTLCAETKHRSEESDRANDEALQEMKKVTGEMKYIMNVKRDVKDAE